MPGPPPSPTAVHRSREAGWVTIPADAKVEDPPKLSLAGLELGRSDQREIRRKWAYWWSSPVATMWDPATDLEGLRRLAIVSVTGKPSALSEIRQLEDRFGLSPSARRRLYWRVEGVDVPSTAAEDLAGGSSAASLPRAGGKSDPRLPEGVTVVDGGRAS